jgi:hypothetical protein
LMEGRIMSMILTKGSPAAKKKASEAHPSEQPATASNS